MTKLSEDADDLYKLLKDTAVNEQQILSEYPQLIELAARLHSALVALTNSQEAVDVEPVPQAVFSDGLSIV